MANNSSKDEESATSLFLTTKAESQSNDLALKTFSERYAQKSSSQSTKALLVFYIACLVSGASLVLIGLFDPLPGQFKRTRSPSAPTQTLEAPCLEPSCILLSASILSSLDTTQDPCENFYDYANGGWLKTHSLPASESSIGRFQDLGKENSHIVKSVLERHTPPTGSVDDKILTKLREFYGSCLDESKLDEVGVAPLLDLVQTVRELYNGNSKDGHVAGLSIDNKVKDLTAAVAFLHSRGIPALFSFDVEGDSGKDPNFMVLWFNQPDLGLPAKEYFKDESILQVYAEVLGRLLVALDHSQASSGSSSMDNGEDDDQKPFLNLHREAYNLAQKVVEFELKIANASLDLVTLRQDRFGTYNPVPVSNLTDTLPQIHFPTYFSTFTPRNYPDRIIVKYPPYMHALSEILNSTDSEVIDAYLVTRAALALSPYLGASTEAWQAQRTLVEAITGVKKGVVGDRSEMCLEKVEESLGFASGRFFVEETFGDDSKEKATKIMSNIIQGFKDSLKHIDWMDEESAIAAAGKADAIRVKVGYPLSPNTRNSVSIAKYYNLVKANKTDYFGNVLSSYTSQTYKKWQKLGKRRDMESWKMMAPSTADAFFEALTNMVVFPAGILRPPFFSFDWPHYISYGSFGHVAAHELSHAFDSAGRMYNQEGKLKQWWTNATSEGYKVKQECIINQYGGYYVEDEKGNKVHVNGNLTQGENIGDSGLIQAYRAWKAQYPTSHAAGNEYLLPGLNYTRDQLFFISFARVWARKMTPAAAVQQIRTDPHSPTRFRVDGTVRNIPAFAEAFGCSAQAKLNPPMEERCIFWGS